MASRTRLLTDGRVSFSIQDKTCLAKAMGILPICILPELEPYDNRDLSAESSEILLYPSCDIVSLNISGGSVIM